MAPGAQRPEWLRAAPATRGALVSVALLVVALLVAVVLLALRPGATRTVGAGATSPTPDVSASSAPTVAEIYRRLGPSVAIVRTAHGALGTGVVADRAGTILTADHVVADGSAITVEFADGTTTSASVASASKATDIATLTPATLPQTLVPATIGGQVQVGGPVVAIGNPLGLTYSVSSGVVSGVDRTADTDQGKFSGLIQFDASVNPGSSGGPLLDADGDVIGIVVSIAEPAGNDAFAGIAFAVPIGAALGGSGGGHGGGPQI